MSFCTDVKNELNACWPKTPCCKVSEAYGLMLFGTAFSLQRICLQTEHPETARRYASLLRKTFHTECRIAQKQKITRVAVAGPGERLKLMTALGQGLDPELKLHRELFQCEHCRAAFIRGAFLSCGQVSDPGKEYHLEFVAGSETAAFGLLQLLRELGFDPKLIDRGSGFVVYLKDSENVEDLLTYMGAPGAALQVMDVKIVKTVRNKANRITNCESANIGKTVSASVAQLTAIERLEQAGRLSGLSPELQETAAARREHPDLALSELAALLGVSRSGVNHRLKKLTELAAEEKDSLS